MITRNDYGGMTELTTILPSGRPAKVDIYRPSDYDFESFKKGFCTTKPEAQVNWSALGSVSIPDAKAYAEMIIMAAAIAEVQ